jgi:SAM-dependent methyltransferase
MKGPGADGDGLSRREYWDSVHSSRKEPHPPRKAGGKRAGGSRLREWARGYDEHLLWNVIYPSFIPADACGKAVEIGSAPGRHLVRLHERFGCDVWGIEYSAEGAEANRKAFTAAGIGADHVIEADFFDDGATSGLEEGFDIVVSRGFIEHFEDPGEVVDRHLRLLRPGGTLILSIPNMRGANYLQALLFNRPLIPIHNREIMRMESFRGLFRDRGLVQLFCGYYGTAKADLFIHRRGAFTGILQRSAYAAQAFLNILFRLVLRGRGLETSLFSPNLLFIGRKKH